MPSKFDSRTLSFLFLNKLALDHVLILSASAVLTSLTYSQKEALED